MVIVLILTKKVGKDILGDWVDLDNLGIVYVFIRKGVFNQALMDVGPITHRIFSPTMKIKGSVVDMMDVISIFMNGCFPS